MIIETPYKVGDTVSIKLSSGEEMVARLEEEKDDHIVIKKLNSTTSVAIIYRITI